MWRQKEVAMTLELKILAWSIVLGLVQILLSAHAASLQVGYRYTATAREARPPLTGVAGRLERALRNFLETFPLFAAAVLLVQVTGRHGPLSEIGAEMYLAARVIYVPLYAGAVPVVRSLVWNVGAIGIVLILLALV
jgi:uncharacterized MAPEG superfamily protein